jgi:prepilin-type N-terminal cleavage/methylation domain-containing protein
MQLRTLFSRARRRLGAERGMTLVELLVTMVVGSTTLLAVMGLVEASQGASGRVTGRVDGTQRGRVAMEQVTQRLRSQTCLGLAPPIVAGDDDSVTFYADMGDETWRAQKRRLFVAGGALKEEIFDGTGTMPALTFPSTPTTTRVVLDGVRPYQSTPTPPYFRFYAYDDQTPARPDALLNAPLSAADIPRVARVELSFSAGNVAVSDRNVDTNFRNGVTTRFANPTDPDPLKRGPQCS